MPKKIISDETRNILLKKVEEFNQNGLTKYNSFKIEIRGKFIYLKLNGEPRCRLKYDGEISNLGFAIYKYSSGAYDSEEFFFPGMGYVNGTIEGAMKASLEAYPVWFNAEDNKTLERNKCPLRIFRTIKRYS